MRISPSKKTKARDSNIELYRILVMFAILCCHWGCATEIGQLKYASAFSIHSTFFYILGMWGKIGIDCFVLITGYFMCMKNITKEKFLKLYLQIVFYNIVIALIFHLSGYWHTSPIGWILLLLPFRQIISDNFMQAFMVFYLFIPFLNKLLHSLKKRELQVLIGLLLFSFSIIDMVPETIAQISLNPICWFSTVYFVGSYLRLYGKVDRAWGLLSIICILTEIVGLHLLLYIDKNTNVFIGPGRLASESSPLALATAVSTFMYFKKLNIKSNKLINTVGATTFGILLIHANSDAMRKWLWRDIFDCVGNFFTPYWWLYPIICLICIYVCCSIIEWFRICTIEKWTLPKVTQMVDFILKGKEI